MRKSTKIMVMAGAIAAVFSAAGAQAQVVEPMKFTTTFPFSVGNKNYPAGKYTVRPLDPTTNIMQLTNDRGSSGRFIVVQNAGIGINDKVTDEVLFKKQGDTYVLSGIRDGADHSGVIVQEQGKMEEPGSKHHVHQG